MSDVDGALKSKHMKADVDEYLKVMAFIYAEWIACVVWDPHFTALLNLHLYCAETRRLILFEWSEAKIAAASEWS